MDVTTPKRVSIMRKPYFREDRGAWYVKTGNGKSQIRLHEDEAQAYRIWQETVTAENPEDVNSPTFAVCEAFLGWAEKNVDSKTYAGYGTYIRSFCDEYGHIRARDLKPFHVTRWLDKNPGWKASDSKRAAIAAVKRVFNWSITEGLMDRNPLAGVRKPTANRREGLITDEQHTAMMLNEDGGRKPGKRAVKLGIKPRRRDLAFRPVLIALKHSGTRPGMVAAVRVEDVSPDLSCWVMKNHKNRKKTGAPLIIYLSPCLQILTRLAMGERTSGPLFLNSHGTAWTSNAIRCRMRALREKLKMPPETVAYAYRHTFLTGALRNGVGLATAAELAGHSDLKMLAKHYAHLDKQPEHLKAAAAIAVRKQA
ncbi:tyrosine-type recombinase/integrase [Anatilimnocola sp. NA78]|uniref:tyrosine-type recombinase/integrase n=1 Tax=Anatilimnocola sp. NA78 TaxID=3415683 RepID=UPI003CE494EC